MSGIDLFETHLRKWGAQPDGEPFTTNGSCLLPVQVDGLPAMMKIARHIEERLGGLVMAWWNGHGAARVYAHDELAGVLLMERATGASDLLEMARVGDDDQASRIVCATLALLHEKRNAAVPKDLFTLDRFFASLRSMAQHEGGLMAECAVIANQLLSTQREHVVLHGDAHHSNILDFGQRGWLAIDPKGVIGERYYDYVNVLCNPDLHTSTDPVRLARQVDVVASAAGLDRHRLLQWVMAHAALSAAWFLEDEARDEAHNELRVARIAQRALSEC